MSICTTGVEGTHHFAAVVARLLSPPTLLVLSGGLGAGKTEFVRGLCQALGLAEEISSPTFVLENLYETPAGVRIHHWDLYRLNEESPDLIDALRDPRGVVVIEWAEKVPFLLRHAALALTFNFVEKEGADRRFIEVRGPLSGAVKAGVCGVSGVEVIGEGEAG
jgi:tRNA threonylcarbamoyladenosine biosynthesis protein TsaE